MRPEEQGAVDGYLVEQTAGGGSSRLLRWDGSSLGIKPLPAGWFGATVAAASSNWAVAAGLVLQSDAS